MATTVKELDNRFKLYLDKVDSQHTADFLPLERQQFLNDAQLWLSRKVCSKKSQDQDEVDLRRTLSTPLRLIPTANAMGDATVQLPADYLHYAFLGAFVTYKGLLQQVRPTIVSEDELLNLLNDPFNQPTIADPVLCFTSNLLHVYPLDIEEIRGSYYRQPASLLLSTPNQLCELPDYLCQVLVNKAVSLALETIQDPRFTTQATSLQNSL